MEDKELDYTDEEDVAVEAVEAVLFSAGTPLTVPDIEEATGISRDVIRDAVKKLINMYKSRRTAIEIKKLGRSYTMQLKSDYKPYVLPLMQEEMDSEVLKTAALIAYYQPVRQSDLKKKVGEKVYGHIEELKDKGLILLEKDGRTYSIRTSSKFQEYFGLEAGDREELKRLMAEKSSYS